MKITITSSSQVVMVRTPGGPGKGEVPARIWEGHTASGIPVICLVTRIAVKNDQDCSQFERELQECKPPSIEAMQVFPLRLIL